MNFNAQEREPISLSSTGEVLAAMERGAHPDQLFSREGYPMLGVAILEDKKALAMSMLDRGADPLLKFNEQVFNSPLAVAMNRLVHKDIFIRMIDDPRVLNVRNESGQSLMHRAAAGCAPVIMLELAKRGLGADLADGEGLTPLRRALNSGGNGGFKGYGMDIAANVRTLLALGASPVELTDAEKKSQSAIIKDAVLAMTEGPMLNAARTRLPDLARFVATSLGSHLDAEDLKRAREFVVTGKPVMAWEAEIQEAVGAFADAARARSVLEKIASKSCLPNRGVGHV